MKNASKLTVLGLIVTTGMTLCTPSFAMADGLQQTKNLWRNIATGAAVLAGVGIATHNNTETAIGAIGTVVGLTQYESARHEQSVQQNGYGWNNGGYAYSGNGQYDQNENCDQNENVVVQTGGCDQRFDNGFRHPELRQGRFEDRQRDQDRFQDRDSNQSTFQGRSGNNNSFNPPADNNSGYDTQPTYHVHEN